MKRILLAILLLSFFAVRPAYAEGGADYSVEVSTKFGRGLANVLSSPAEIPCAIRDEVKGRGGVGLVTGLFRGIVFMARRILVGVTEAATFMIPMEATLPPVCVESPEPAINP